MVTIRLKAPLTVELGDLHMFERFTERARQVIVMGQDTAAKHHHGFIGTEHILHGLMREEEGMASRVLVELGLTASEVERSILHYVGVGEAASDATERRAWTAVPFTPRARKALELALREALSLGHNYIGTEHILLGVVRVCEKDDSAIAFRILSDHGIDLEAVRNGVIDKLNGIRRDADPREREPEEDCDDVGTKVRALPTVQERLARVESFLGIPDWWLA